MQYVKDRVKPLFSGFFVYIIWLSGINLAYLGIKKQQLGSFLVKLHRYRQKELHCLAILTKTQLVQVTNQL
ncbi:hypothetical protein B6N25_16105 [Sphingobacteriales bacterium TSM_CSS]|nr:hypothetical protein B6N25_16105 [Sphingobacteriales bacterium TSM_CSS]